MRKWRNTLLFMLVLAMFTRALALPYAIVYLLALSLAAAEIARRLAFRKLKVTRTLHPRAVSCGEVAEMRVTLANSGRIPLPWVAFGELLPGGLRTPSGPGQVVSLGGRRKVMVRCPIEAVRRGYYRLKTLSVTAGDLFGLGEESATYRGEEDLTVYPRVRTLPEFGLPTLLPFGSIRTRNRVFEDPVRVIGVRDYHPGDPESRIHWKATARFQSLQVKEYQPTIALQTAVFLDLDPGRYLSTRWHLDGEIAIELAASLIYRLGREGEGCALFSNGRDMLSPEGEHGPVALAGASGFEQVQKALATLACIEMSGGFALSDLLSQSIGRLAWGSTLLVVTPRDDERLVGLCLALAKRGYQPVIFVVQNDLSHPELGRPGGVGGVLSYSVRLGGDGNAFRVL